MIFLWELVAALEATLATTGEAVARNTHVPNDQCLWFLDIEQPGT
jgi:hypothetical protein